MKFGCPLIAVSDMDRSIRFYTEVLGQEVTVNIGGYNVAFGQADFALQLDFGMLIGEEGFVVGEPARDHELVFEEEDFDGFLNKLEGFADIEYVHREKTYPWHQRVVRFYDPDHHVVEVGETMKSVFQRMVDGGMSLEEVAKECDVPMEYLQMELGR